MIRCVQGRTTEWKIAMRIWRPTNTALLSLRGCSNFTPPAMTWLPRSMIWFAMRGVPDDVYIFMGVRTDAWWCPIMPDRCRWIDMFARHDSPTLPVEIVQLNNDRALEFCATTALHCYCSANSVGHGLHYDPMFSIGSETQWVKDDTAEQNNNDKDRFVLFMYYVFQFVLFLIAFYFMFEFVLIILFCHSLILFVICYWLFYVNCCYYVYVWFCYL